MFILSDLTVPHILRTISSCQSCMRCIIFRSFHHYGEKTLGEKELFENRQMTKQNGQQWTVWMDSHMCAPCLRGSSFSIHIPGRELEVQHGQNHQPGKNFRKASLSKKKMNLSYIAKNIRVSYHKLYHIYIYTSYHIKKQYLSVSFEHPIISYHNVSLTMY